MNKIELSEQIRWIESTIKKNVSLHLLLSDSKILLESIKQLQAENEAMRKDAARYQWIRDMHQYTNRGWEIVREVDREEWDEAIDEAMEQTK
jgi:hypothetical protein